MIMRGPVLSQEEIVRIHDESVRILEEVGVKVPSEKVLAILEKAGATIDWDNKVALISRSMIDKALADAPKEFLLGARNPKFDMVVPHNKTVLSMDGCGSYTYDFKTGKRRLANLQDLADVGKVFDAMETTNMLWSCIMPAEIAAGPAPIISTAESMLACGKHFQDEVQKIQEVPFYLELLKAFVGTEQEVIDRKIFSMTYCTVAPLCHDEEMLEGTLEMATKYDQPVNAYPMPASGSTGPASVFANVALGNAENLSSIVIFQTVKPGTPVIYGSALGRINIKTGAFLEGAVETSIMMVAMTQMGKHYGLPTESAGCLSDAHEPGMQTMMEKVFGTLPLTLAEPDIIQGIGLIEGSMTLSLEQMIIDEEIFKQALRMKAGIDSAADKELFEDIKAVAQGGHYLKQKSSRKAFRTDEFYNSKLIPDDSYDGWIAKGSPSMFDMAHEKVARILEADPVSPVDANTEKLVREIVEAAKAAL